MSFIGRYMRIADAPIVETEEVFPCLMVDLDADGQIVGIEYLGPDASCEHRERRKTAYPFASPEDRAEWQKQKEFIDEGWEGPSGDFSKTDIKKS